jgi:hypothetical protein
MRAVTRSSVGAVALAALLTLVAGASAPAAAAPAGTAGTAAARPAAATYRFVARYPIIPTACRNAGQAGVDSGEWDAFVCIPRRAGLDIVAWDLYVTP